MATIEDMSLLKSASSLELITPVWEMIEFMDEENKKMKDLRNATKRNWLIN